MYFFQRICATLFFYRYQKIGLYCIYAKLYYTYKKYNTIRYKGVTTYADTVKKAQE